MHTSASRMRLVLMSVSVFVVAWRNIASASNNNQYVEEIQMRDFKCSASTTDIGGTRSVTHCGMKCSSTVSCKTFFYNSQLQTCSISPVMYDSTSGCLVETGTKYYRKNDTVFGSACTTVADCWMSNMACLNSVCKCSIGYVYDQTTRKCGTGCASYGTSYSLYPNTELSVPYTSASVTSLQDCLDACSASATCRGVTFCCAPGNPQCRLKDQTPLTGSITTFNGVDYYIRNCA